MDPANSTAENNGINSAVKSLDVEHSLPESAQHQQAIHSSNTTAFNKDGAIGSMFKADGAIGGMADKIGGPLAKDGFVGEKFNPDGKIGGTVHENLGKRN